LKDLDAQLARFGAHLRDNIGIDERAALKVATTVAADLRFLPVDAKTAIANSSVVSVETRLAELTAFQTFMDFVRTHQTPHPALVRAQVLCQNYICFAYLGDALFKILLKATPPDSLTRKCVRFLTDNPVRAFRNAIAHGNWCYRTDFSGLAFWARKGADSSEPMQRFEVSAEELDFWQALSRGVAYAAYSQLRVRNGREAGS
jgi:hypothetical protein